MAATIKLSGTIEVQDVIRFLHAEGKNTTEIHHEKYEYVAILK